MKQVDLKDFIRNLVNSMPKVRKPDSPIFFLEFDQGRKGDDFSSRIEVYRVESLKVLHYKFSSNHRGRGMRTWSIVAEDYAVLNLIPPHSSGRSIVFRGDVDYPLIIQAGYFRK